MAFKTIQPMHSRQTFAHLEGQEQRPNFFLRYLHDRIRLTDAKRKERAQHELNALSQDERRWKDEEIRLRQNITNLRRSLLNREQAWLSRSHKDERNSSSVRIAEGASGGSAGSDLADLRSKQRRDANKQQSEWNTAFGQVQQGQQTWTDRGSSFRTAIGSLLSSLGDRLWRKDDGARQKDLLDAYKVLNNGTAPRANGPNGASFVEAYKWIKKTHGDDAARAFKKAVYGTDMVNYLGRPVLITEDPNFGQEHHYGDLHKNTSLQAEKKWYSDAVNTARVKGIEAHYEAQIQEARDRANQPRRTTTTTSSTGGGSGGGGTSGDMGAPASPQTRATERQIADYEARLREIQEKRGGVLGRRRDILDDFLGPRTATEMLTPYEVTDPATSRILDEVMGIEDEEARNRALREGRMLIDTERAKLAPEFVESQVLNRQALQGHYQDAWQELEKAKRTFARAHAAAVRLRAKYEEMVKPFENDPNRTVALDAMSSKLEPIIAAIESQERLQRRAEERMQIMGQVHDALEMLQGPRGATAEWSSLSPQNRLLVLQAINAKSTAKASRNNDEISNVREEIRLAKFEIQDLEQSLGPRTSADFRNSDPGRAALQNLQENQQALNRLLTEQNEHVMFSGEAQGAIDHLVANDPAYRIQPPASLGLGVESPALDVLEDDLEEEAMTEWLKEGGLVGEDYAEGILEGADQTSLDAALREGALGDNPAQYAQTQLERQTQLQTSLEERINALSDESIRGDTSAVFKIQQDINAWLLEQGKDPIKEDGLWGSTTQDAINDGYLEGLQIQLETAKEVRELTEKQLNRISEFEKREGRPEFREEGEDPGASKVRLKKDGEVVRSYDLPEMESTEVPEELVDSKLTIPTGGARYQTPGLSVEETVEGARAKSEELDQAGIIEVEPVESFDWVTDFNTPEGLTEPEPEFDIDSFEFDVTTEDDPLPPPPPLLLRSSEINLLEYLEAEKELKEEQGGVGSHWEADPPWVWEIEQEFPRWWNIDSYLSGLISLGNNAPAVAEYLTEKRYNYDPVLHQMLSDKIFSPEFDASMQADRAVAERILGHYQSMNLQAKDRYGDDYQNRVKTHADILGPPQTDDDILTNGLGL